MMLSTSLTRRRFAAVTAAALASRTVHVSGQPPGTVAASELVHRIAERSAVPLPKDTVDGFKAGQPETPVRGIAVTAMATMAVLRQAAKAGLNLVLSFEPTFYGRSDAQPNAPAPPFGGRVLVAQDDPILVAKRAFLESNRMVVYRLHDQWAGRKENELATAVAAAMGWSRAAGGATPLEYEIAPAALSTLVTQVRARLKVMGGMRVVGDPASRVRRVAVLPGLQPLTALMAGLQTSDVVLVGESRDWEGAEYAGDATAAGQHKSMISVGRVVSEDPGMRACAAWLKGFVSEVPVQWIPSGDPFWRPV